MKSNVGLSPAKDQLVESVVLVEIVEPVEMVDIVKMVEIVVKCL